MVEEFWRKSFFKAVRDFSSTCLILEKWGSLNMTKFEFPFPGDALWHIKLKSAQCFSRHFVPLTVVGVFSLFCFCLSFEKDRATYLSIHVVKSYSPNNALCQVWLKLGQKFCIRKLTMYSRRSENSQLTWTKKGKKHYFIQNTLPLELGSLWHHSGCKLVGSLPRSSLWQLPPLHPAILQKIKIIFQLHKESCYYIHQCIFAIFLKSSPLGKGHCLSFEKFLVPRILCAKFGWNWLSGHLEKKIFNFWILFCYFIITYPWKSTWPFLYLSSSWMLFIKFGWNWQRLDFQILSVYVRFFFIHVSPLGKGWGLSFEQTWIISLKDALFLVWFLRKDEWTCDIYFISQLIIIGNI